MKALIFGCACVLAASTVTPVSAEIRWKSCHAYMEGFGPRQLHVVVHHLPSGTPFTTEQRTWVKHIGTICEHAWRKNLSCSATALRTNDINFWNVQKEESFEGNCKSGAGTALASPLVLKNQH